MKGDVKGEHRGLVRMQGRSVISNKHGFADIAAEAKPVKPLAGSKPKPVKKPPVGKGHVCHQYGRYMKLSHMPRYNLQAGL